MGCCLTSSVNRLKKSCYFEQNPLRNNASTTRSKRHVSDNSAMFSNQEQQQKHISAYWEACLYTTLQCGSCAQVPLEIMSMLPTVRLRRDPGETHSEARLKPHPPNPRPPLPHLLPRPRHHRQLRSPLPKVPLSTFSPFLLGVGHPSVWPV